MLYCDRIDISEGTDVNKTKEYQQSVIFLVFSRLSFNRVSPMDVTMY